MIEINVKILKSKRVLLGLRQKDVAKGLDLTEKTYCLKENGKTDFTRQEIDKISIILKLDLDDVNLIFFDNKITKCI
ncbi:helix-turn-helix transcriptional regulator [Metaclostridioides mangenotii]|uniref:Transcriptional regulator with XRE-family HTH domain n=1 Tax=Metaclostridioides mangenotii TaxID=1540 RepID=A0ABS4E6X8_9FIRM|nr:transcriptional regulator with XRE-family HTH domain [Clostridioides mangenotii]